MDTLLTALQSMVTLCLIMAVGFVAKRRNILSYEASAQISGLLSRVTLPCLMIMAVQKPFSPELLGEAALTFAISFSLHFICLFIGWLLCKVLKFTTSEKSVFLFAMAFTNMAFMGFPVVSAIYGENALFYASFANIAFNLLSFSLGVKIISGGKYGGFHVKQILNPVIVATLFGLVLFLFSIKIPPIFGNALQMVGNMTTPLSMIIIGILLTQADFKSLFLDYRLYIYSLFRLLILPIALFFVLKLFLQSDDMIGALSITWGMPAASMTAILAVQFNADDAFASRIVFLSTILSVFTIPILGVVFRL